MLLDIAGYCWSTDIDPRNVTQVLEEDGATTTSAFLKPFEPQPHIATPLRSFVGLGLGSSTQMATQTCPRCSRLAWYWMVLDGLGMSDLVFVFWCKML